MSISPTRKPPNGNPGTVPPWLEHPDPNVPHTWDEIEQALNGGGFHEYRGQKFNTQYDQETIE